MFSTGLEIFIHKHLACVADLRVGLVTHPAAVDAGMRDTLTALRTAGVNVTTLFGPEHGYHGLAADGAAVDHGVDARTHLPVFSLYGDTKMPTPEMLENVDVLVFDMQDVGVRYYTYLSTLYYVLKGAAAAGRPVIVLDRPNPIDGVSIEGPGVEPGFESFVGIVSIPMRHGMTMGELAQYLNHHCFINANLTVIRMEGWKRSHYFDETGRNWVPTSPAIPQVSTTITYPGTCLCEGTTLTEGRGTALPFEVVGAPWLDGVELAEKLNHLRLPGLLFRHTAIKPASSKHANQVCGAVQLHVTERRVFRPVRTALHLIATIQQLCPQNFSFLPSSWEGRPAHFDLLVGCATVRTALVAGATVDEVTDCWDEFENSFFQARRPYLLY